MQLYKATGPNGAPCYGGTGDWKLGEWREVEGPLVPCQHGLHLLRRQDVVHWLGEELYEAETECELL